MPLHETLIDLTVHDIRLAQNALVSLKRELPIEGTSADFSRDARHPLLRGTDPSITPATPCAPKGKPEDDRRGCYRQPINHLVPSSKAFMSFLQTQLEWTGEDIRQSHAVLEDIECEKLDTWPSRNAGVSDQRLETKARMYRERLQTAHQRLERRRMVADRHRSPRPTLDRGDGGGRSS